MIEMGKLSFSLIYFFLICPQSLEHYAQDDHGDAN